MVDTSNAAGGNIDFNEVVRRRHMVRGFETRPIDADTLDRILASSLRGPSAGFTQGFDLLVLQGGRETGRFWAATPASDTGRDRWPNISNAPVIVVFLSDEGAYTRRFAEPDKASGPGVPWWLVDTSFAAMIMLLSVVDAHLGAIFLRVNDPDAVAHEFDIPPGHDPVGAIAIGHPRDNRPSASAARRRRPFDEVVHRGRW
jgi:nitroreductase